MSNTVNIVGYQQEEVCQHRGRKLKHGIVLDNGMIVGATCLDKVLTAPKQYNGKAYRLGTELIIRAAKVVQMKTPAAWSRYGVSAETIRFVWVAA